MLTITSRYRARPQVCDHLQKVYSREQIRLGLKKSSLIFNSSPTQKIF